MEDITNLMVQPRDSDSERQPSPEMGTFSYQMDTASVIYSIMKERPARKKLEKHSRSPGKGRQLLGCPVLNSPCQQHPPHQHLVEWVLVEKTWPGLRWYITESFPQTSTLT